MDKKKCFAFAPLKGETASMLSSKEKKKQSVVLVLNYKKPNAKKLFKFKAIFTILWNLHGFWKATGWKHIFPAWMSNWAYDLIAKNRRHLCKSKKVIPQKYKKRFLP